MHEKKFELLPCLHINLYYVLTICFKTVHVCSSRCAIQTNAKEKLLHLKPISFTLIKPKDKCEKKIIRLKNNDWEGRERGENERFNRHPSKTSQ